MNRVRPWYVALATLLRHIDEFILNPADALLKGLHLDLLVAQCSIPISPIAHTTSRETLSRLRI